MGSRMPLYIVIGSDGLVGRALEEHLQHTGVQVMGTTRRPERVDRTHLFLELGKNDPAPLEFPSSATVAFICAGITNAEACRRDPKGSACVNVEATARVVEQLVRRRIFVIYLSTNQVFDGATPYRRAEEPYSPTTTYGRQKSDVEQAIKLWGERVAIVRFTKILGTFHPLFSEWTEVLKKNEPIHPFSDLVLAPVPLACAVSVLRLIAELRLAGVWQVSGHRDVSYAEAACWGAQVLGANERLIEPVSARTQGFSAEPIPTHTTLDIDRLRSVLGIEPPDVRWTIERAFTTQHSAMEFARSER